MDAAATTKDGLGSLVQSIQALAPDWLKPWLDLLGVWSSLAVLVLLGLVPWASATRKTWTQWHWVQSLGHRVLQKRLPHAQQFSVAVVHLEGDTDGRFREQIMDALRDLQGLRRLHFDRRTTVNRADDMELAEAQTQTRAQTWLRESDAQVLIWGRVLRATGAGVDQLRLHFVAKDAMDTANLRMAGDQVLNLPLQALPQLSTVVRAQVLAQVALHNKAGSVQARELHRVLGAVTPVVQNWSDSVVRADMALSLAESWRVVGDLLGDGDALATARDLAAMAAAQTSREVFPLNWARAQVIFGGVLLVLGKRSGDEALLGEAVAAYRAALQEFTQARVPQDWAATQNNLGIALQTLGARSGDEVLLGEAVVAYRAALQEYTQARVPQSWATTQNNLGNALQTLGARSGDEALLREAVAAYRAALQEYTQARVPQDWAATQNNLGNVLQALGKRSGDEALLREAVEAYRAALQEYTQARVPQDWAMTQNNLGNVLQALGARSGDEALLGEAVAALEAALDVYQTNGAVVNAGKAERNLVRARKALEALRSER